MVSRSFPLALNIGTDICKLARIRRFIQPARLADGRHTPKFDRFLGKVLTPQELLWFRERFGHERDAHRASNEKQSAITAYVGGRYVVEDS